MSQSQREEGHNTICPHKRGEGNFKMKYIPLIIVLLLILAILVLVFYGVSRVKRFSRQLFGTDDIIQGVNKAALLSPHFPPSEFPHSVPSPPADTVSGHFLRAASSHRIENPGNRKRSEAGQSLSSQKPNAVLTRHPPVLFSQISASVSEGRREHFTQVKIHQTEIARYRKEAGRCIVTFQSAVESFHYVTDEANVVVRGSDHTLEQSRYNTDLVYIQNRALAKDAADNAIGITCPNCGAPVTNLGAKFCEYCGAGIIELNVHAWLFENIEEA